MKKGSRRAPTRLSVQNLETRCLLSGVSASWVGQNGQDYTGPYYGLKPDGIQDIDIHLADIPAGRSITSADILGLGGGEWKYNGPYGSWSASLVSQPATNSADLFFQPGGTETGRPYNLILTFDDGSQTNLWVNGGPVNSNLRMPSETLQVAWIGQDGSDLAGPGPGVGPDGTQDVHLALSQLSPSSAIQAVHVTSTSGDAWQFGLNPQGLPSAELIRNSSDPSKADLYLNPDQTLAGQTLTIHVLYANGNTDSATLQGESVDPSLKVPAPPALPSLVSGVSAAWIGQDGQAPEGPGWARFSVSGLPSGVSVLGASLSGPNHDSWTYQAPGQTSYYSDLYASPLGFHPGSGGQADLAFPPDRNEANTTLTLRLTFSDGRMAIVPVSAGSTDLSLLSAQPAPSTVQAHPGDDLNALAPQYGVINLAPGEYDLSAPLVLNNPVTIRAPQGGATLVFSQTSGDAPWTAAIKIHCGNTTLDNLSVRFSGPIRWNWNVNYSPAVIGTTDNLDPPGHNDPKTNLQLTNLNLQAPPAGSSGEEAPELIRLTSARGGVIRNCTLQGGTTEFLYGPWTIENNTYLGTMPGTWAWDVFAGHSTHDLIIQHNTVALAPNAGRTWRFLVLTNHDDGAEIQGNSISGLGPKDTDTSSSNSAEVILTESYNLDFEGKPLALSADGRILQIPSPQGQPPSSGDVVAILDGPNAGTWVRVAQAISPTMLLLDSPLPSGSHNVSIAQGFVNETYANNTIDTRGSSVAANLDLVGGHYGTRVLDNTILGGGDGILVQSYPSESPSIWGWSHMPFLGGVISGNTVTDTVRAITLKVDHGPAIKTDLGRTYLSATVSDNTIVWNPAFEQSVPGQSASGITIGQNPSMDADELRVSIANNRADAAPRAGGGPTLDVIAANVNGQTVSDQVSPLPQVLPSAPTSLTLVHDSGQSGSDRITNDARLAVGPATGARSYAYRVGETGLYQAISDPSSFLPTDLVQGLNTVSVHGLDAYGRSGPDSAISFIYDTVAPSASPPGLLASSDTGRSSSDRVTSRRSPVFYVPTDAGDQAFLLRDGQKVASVASNLATDPGPAADGKRVYSVIRQDLAGNVSLSGETVVTIDTQAPGAVSNLSASGSTVGFSPPESADTFAYRVNSGAWVPLGTQTSFSAQGLLPARNLVEVRAIDQAGNVGPAASVVVDLAPVRVSGTWIGQDGHDLVGPYPIAAPDGTQDVHLKLQGLPTTRSIVFLDIQGLGGSQWQYGGGWGPWKAAVLQAPGSSSADVYIQPDRVETGRPFQVTIWFSDGTTTGLWIRGGKADPALKMPASQGTSVTEQGAGTPSALKAQGPGMRAVRGGEARRLARREAIQSRVAVRNPGPHPHPAYLDLFLQRRQQRLAHRRF